MSILKDLPTCRKNIHTEIYAYTPDLKESQYKLQETNKKGIFRTKGDGSQASQPIYIGTKHMISSEVNLSNC